MSPWNDTGSVTGRSQPTSSAVSYKLNVICQVLRSCPDSDLYIKQPSLKRIRWRTGSQCNSRRTGVMWSHRLDSDTSRAAAFWTDCSFCSVCWCCYWIVDVAVTVVTHRCSTSCCTGDIALSCISNWVRLRNTRDIYRLRESIARLCQEGIVFVCLVILLTSSWDFVHLWHKCILTNWLTAWLTNPTTQWLCRYISVTEFDTTDWVKARACST